MGLCDHECLMSFVSTSMGICGLPAEYICKDRDSKFYGRNYQGPHNRFTLNEIKLMLVVFEWEPFYSEGSKQTLISSIVFCHDTHYSLPKNYLKLL